MSYNKYQRLVHQVSTDGGRTWTTAVPVQYARGELIERNSLDCQPSYRWVVISDEFICAGTEGFDKYEKLKKQVSIDGGTTWTDVVPLETQAGNLIQRNSVDCGAEPEYKWEVDHNRIVCDGTTAYYALVEYVSYDNRATWTETGNVQKSTVVYQENYPDCIQTVYRWIDTGNYVCVGTSKYAEQKQQVSYNSGTTWQDTGSTRAGSLIENYSVDCGATNVEWVNVEGVICETNGYRWVDSGTFICIGSDKYTVLKEQKSTDGTAWTDTGVTKTGELVETSSEVCGIAPYGYIRTNYLLQSGLANANGYNPTVVKYVGHIGDYYQYNLLSKPTGTSLEHFIVPSARQNSTTTAINNPNCVVEVNIPVDSTVTSLREFMMGSLLYPVNGTTVNVEEWDTSSITDMFAAFTGNFSGEIDLSSWDTSKVTTFYEAFNFHGATSIKLPLNFGSAVNLSGMLYNTTVSSIDLSGLSSLSGNVNLTNLLANTSLSSVDLSPLSSSSMNEIVCDGLVSGNTVIRTLDLTPLSGFKITYAHGIVAEDTSLQTVNMSGLSMSGSSKMGRMFGNCESLTTIYMNNLSVDLPFTNSTNSFENCNSLRNIYMSGANQYAIDSINAHLSSAGLSSQVTVHT